MGNFKKSTKIIKRLCTSLLQQNEIAHEFEVSASYVSQIKNKIRTLKYPPKIVEEEVVCFKCEQKSDDLCFHHNHTTQEMLAIVCHSCNVRLGDGRNGLEYQDSRIIPMKIEAGKVKKELRDWKMGFEELYRFFKDIMKQSDIVIKDDLMWNHLLGERNIGLITKLGEFINE